MSFFRDLKRIVKEGNRIVRRNVFTTFSSIFVMSLSLLVISLIFVFYSVLNHSLTKIGQRVDINIYFSPDAPNDEIDKVIAYAQGIPEVEKVRFIPKEEALKNFLERYKKDELIKRSIDEVGENPLGASLNIQAKDISQYESIVNTLQDDNNGFIQSPYIDYINYKDNKHIINRLNTFSRISRKVAYATMLFLALVAIFIIFNVLSLVIYHSKEEISIKQIVGAENRYVSGPFAVSGIIYGLISAIIVIASLYPIMKWFGQLTETFFGEFNVFHYFMTNLPYLAVLILSVGIMMGYITSIILVKRFLR